MTQNLHRPIFSIHTTMMAVILICLWPFIASGQEQSPQTPPWAVSAADIDEATLHFQRRPVMVFANSPTDPQFLRQMDLLTRVQADFDRRDVIVIIDTDPAANSPLRQKFRPRGFSVILLDKDWHSAIRKPLPLEGREIINAIDRMPLARNEAFDRSPAGR